MSDSVISCPRCRRRMRIAEGHLGMKVRCASCGSVFLAERDGASPSGAAASARPANPPEEPNPWGVPRDAGEGGGGKSPAPLPVAIAKDPEGERKGVYKGEIRPDGLLLRQGKHEPLWIPVGSDVEYDAKSRITTVIDGRELTLTVGRMNLYNERLARDLAAFLQGRRGAPDLADYAVPWYLLLAALLPFGMMGVFLQGGLIGGALGGGLAGGLVGANLGLLRRERWPVGARLAACLGVSAAGYLVLALVVLALMRHSAGGEATGWGTPEDPLGDCRIAAEGNGATIEVPGTLHDLSAPPGRTDAPRLVRPVDAGDFTAEVTLVGEDPIADPPAAGARIAFHGAGLFLAGEGGVMLRLERAALVRGGQVQRYVLFERHAPGAPRIEDHGAYDGGTIHLRLERRGTQVLGAYSLDGVHWRTLAPRAFPAGPAKVGVAAVNTAGAPFVARFERLRVGRP